MTMIMTQFYHPIPDLEIKNGIYKTKIDGLYFVSSQLHEDSRGFFAELCKIPSLNEILDKPFIIKQINHAHSQTYVVRGMHAESWRKLVAIVKGTAFCALVDIRPDSLTFKQVEIFNLGPQALYGCLFVPIGVANSIAVEKDEVEYLYFVDALYKDRNPKGDQAISLFDPDLQIPWPIEKEKMIISERDQKSVQLRDLYPEKF
ncbi:dTDP-4-keto-6-deoxy-D-glucose epimerase [Candidatus Beckwithbacteria bacterium]|nr:dTDP-4-keto-6-deoxy-D-glucose epimerase [Candidatus Beckwithbacteria bacterium]